MNPPVEPLVIANLFIFTAELIISILFLFRYIKKKDRTLKWYVDFEIWLGIVYFAISFLFMQMYIRMVFFGNKAAVSELRIYILGAGVAMIIAIWSTAVRHGLFDNLIDKIVELENHERD